MTTRERAWLDAYMALFVGRADDYALQLSNGSYCRVGRPITRQEITNHLQGVLTYGTYLMDASGQCRFAVIDADGEDGLDRLWIIQTQLAGQSIPSSVEASRRGGHLWVFFSSPAPASQVRAWLRPFCPPDLEFYPKQNEGRGYGSLIRLPLGVHRKSGQRYPFVTRGEDGELVVQTATEQDRAAWLASIVRVEVPHQHAPEQLSQKATPPLPRSGSLLSIRHWNAEQDPLQVIGRYVELKENEGEGVGCCPFGEHHTGGQDTQASFKVYRPGVPGGYCWYCYTWQQGGSVFDFLRYYYDLDARTLWQRLQAEEVHT